MFRLKATLVPTTVLRPWRTGWSVDRGVDFSLAFKAARPAPAPPRDDTAPAERACFIEEDGCEGSRSFASLAGPDSATDDSPEAGAVRGWWSLAGKPSRT